MSKSSKTIEVISCPKTVSDLWDEFGKDIDPSSIVVKMVPNLRYHCRFLGPFLTVNRLFVPLIISKNISKDKILSIVNGDDSMAKDAIEKISKIVQPSSKEDREFRNFFNKKKFTGKFGQACIMVNALIKNSDVNFSLKVFPMSTQICNEMRSHNDYKISGIKARDVIISKSYPEPTNRSITSTNMSFGGSYNVNNNVYNINNVHGIQNQGVSIPSYVVEFLKESFLTQKQIDYVLRNGLFDIKKIIKDLNTSQFGNYIYKEISDYKMPENLNNVIFGEMIENEENRHIEKAEEEFCEIPESAFENVDRLRDPIGSLEID